MGLPAVGRRILRITCAHNDASLALSGYLRYPVYLENQRRGVLVQVSRLERSLNKPVVVLVVGVVAVALNVLLYFGYFLPKMKPIIGNINPIGISLPEAISKSVPETGSNSDPGPGGKSDSRSLVVHQDLMAVAGLTLGGSLIVSEPITASSSTSPTASSSALTFKLTFEFGFGLGCCVTAASEAVGLAS